MTVTNLRPDGRRERSTRTRAAILAAHRSLIVGGELAPTANRIAEVAGISPRTFFAHFPDLESLFAATTEEVYAEVLLRRRHIDHAMPLAERTDVFLRAREDIYRFLTPYSLATRLRERTSPILQERRTGMALLSRADVAEAFAPELAGLPEEDAHDIVAGLETSITWSSWYHLTEELALGAEAARRIMKRLVLLQLGPGE